MKHIETAKIYSRVTEFNAGFIGPFHLATTHIHETETIFEADSCSYSRL